MDIKNKVVIVTGGSGGMGFATVQSLLKNEAKHVAIFDIDSSKNKICLEKLNEKFRNGRTSVHTCDIANATQFSELYDKIVKSQKNVDILINCSGVFNDKQPSLTISVNLTGVVNSCLVAIEKMGKHKNGHGGTIVNVASVAGLISFPVCPVYVATKHGVVGFTTSLKETYNHTNVRALAICPGATETPMAKSRFAVRQHVLDLVEEELINKYIGAFNCYQPPENVAESIIAMIKHADPGAVWVSEDNKPPFAVQDLPFYRERKIE